MKTEFGPHFINKLAMYIMSNAANVPWRTNNVMHSESVILQ